MAAAGASAPGAGVLAGIAGVDQSKTRLTQPSGKLLGGEAELRADPRRKLGAGEHHGASFNPPAFIDPSVPTPLEHADLVVAMVCEGPPEPARELSPAMVNGDDVGLIADPALGHRLREPLRRCDLSRDRVIEIDDVPSPVDIDRGRDVSMKVFIRRSTIVGVFNTRFDRPGHHITAHVDHAQVGLIQVGVQPLGRDEEIVRLGHASVPGGFIGGFLLR